MMMVYTAMEDQYSARTTVKLLWMHLAQTARKEARDTCQVGAPARLELDQVSGERIDQADNQNK